MTEEVVPGARFSTCANVLWQLQPKIEDDMELARHGLSYEPFGNMVALFEDAKRIVRSNDGERTAEEVRALNPNDAERLPDWNRFWQRAATLIHHFLLRDAPSLDEVRAQARRQGDEEILDVLLTKSKQEVCDSFFEDERVKATFLDGEDVGLQAPGGALIEAWWKTGGFTRPGSLGGTYVRGGMGSVAEAMRSAAEEAGVRVLTNSPVERILREDGAVTGVELADGQRLLADTVVSNADPKRTFDRLLAGPTAGAEEIPSPEWSTRIGYQKFHSVVRELPDLREYFGGEQPPPKECATLKISPSLELSNQAFAAAEAGELPEVPVIGGMFIPSIFDPQLAPAGHHTLSAWVLYAPGQLASGSWDAAREEAGRRFISRTTEFIPNFEESLVDWRILLPGDLEARNLSTDGNIRHLDVVPDQFLGSRPAPGWGHRSPVRGLYLCGAGTHPGGEVSGAPGFNAARCLLQDLDLAGNRAPEDVGVGPV